MRTALASRKSSRIPVKSHAKVSSTAYLLITLTIPISPGLAILFFLLSLTGNVTYFISLLAYSQEKSYLLNAVPWFLGSLGTVGEDMIVFAQFRKYSGNKETSPA